MTTFAPLDWPALLANLTAISHSHDQHCGCDRERAS